MALTEYKKISEMTQEGSSNIIELGMFPFIVPGTIDNFIVSYNNLSDIIRENNSLLTLQLNSGTPVLYNGTEAKSLNITPNNIGTYTTTEINNLINNHVNQTLTLQVQGITKGTYNGGTATTINVNRIDLDVYSKTEVDSKDTDIKNLMMYKPKLITSTTSQYQMEPDRDTYVYLEKSDSVWNMQETSTGNITTEFSLLLKNIGTGNMTINFPTDSNYINYRPSVILPVNKTIEIIVKGYGDKRAVTYLIFG